MVIVASRNGLHSAERQAETPRRVGTTMALEAYSKLKADILSATIPPGKKLLIRDLCELYGTGASPMREALTRLCSEGLVIQSAQKGFSVASFSIEELLELYQTKKWLNELGLRQSILLGDARWEEQIVLSFHRLSRAPRYLPVEPPARNPAWDEAHKIFHSALIDACGSQWLKGFCAVLFDASERYRALARLGGNTRSTHIEEHEAIMKAAVERDADRAVALLNEHFARTAELVKGNLHHADRT